MHPMSKEETMHALQFSPVCSLSGYALESAGTYGFLIDNGEDVTPQQWAERIAATYDAEGNPRIRADMSAIYHAPFRRIESRRRTLTFVP